MNAKMDSQQCSNADEHIQNECVDGDGDVRVEEESVHNGDSDSAKSDHDVQQVRVCSSKK